MVEDLKPFSVNAGAWRHRNGFITPEWEMYVKNRRCVGIVLDVLMSACCMLLGAMLTIKFFY